MAEAIHRASPRAPGALREGELRGAAGGPARERAVRAREGLVHRRGGRPGGALRGGERRDALPRRGGGDPAPHPGEAPPRAPEPGDRAAWASQPTRPRGRAPRRGHERRPRGPRAEGRLPRGLLLPPEGGDGPAARRCGSAAGHPPARRALPARSTPERHGRATHGIPPEALRRARGPTTGRGTCASSRTSSRPRWCSPRARRSAVDVLPGGGGGRASGSRTSPTAEGIRIPPGTSLPEAERRIILDTLQRTDGNKTAAARILGIGLRTLYRKLEQYDAGGRSGGRAGLTCAPRGRRWPCGSAAVRSCAFLAGASSRHAPRRGPGARAPPARGLRRR